MNTRDLFKFAAERGFPVQTVTTETIEVTGGGHGEEGGYKRRTTRHVRCEKFLRSGDGHDSKTYLLIGDDKGELRSKLVEPEPTEAPAPEAVSAPDTKPAKTMIVPKSKFEQCPGHKFHEPSPNFPGQCRHCSQEVFFRCNRCGPIVARLVEVPDYNPHRRGGPDTKRVLVEFCPHCKRECWEISSYKFRDSYGPSFESLRTTSAHYRALVIAAGKKPGRAIQPPKCKATDSDLKSLTTTPASEQEIKLSTGVSKDEYQRQCCEAGRQLLSERLKVCPTFQAAEAARKARGGW